MCAVIRAGPHFLYSRRTSQPLESASSHWRLSLPLPRGVKTRDPPVFLCRLYQDLAALFSSNLHIVVDQISTNSPRLGVTMQMQVIWHVLFVLFVSLFVVFKKYPEAKSNGQPAAHLLSIHTFKWNFHSVVSDEHLPYFLRTSSVGTWLSFELSV